MKRAGEIVLQILFRATALNEPIYLRASVKNLQYIVRKTILWRVIWDAQLVTD